MQTYISELLKENNKDLSIIKSLIVISLVIFASLIAPKLPPSYLNIIDNMFVKFLLFTGIAYLATCDLVSAIIATIAVIVTLQTLSVHKITNKIIDETKIIVNNNLQQLQKEQKQHIESNNNFVIDFPHSEQVPITLDSTDNQKTNKKKYFSLEPEIKTQTVIIENQIKSAEDPYLKLRDFINNIHISDPKIDINDLYNAIITSNTNLNGDFVKEIIKNIFTPASDNLKQPSFSQAPSNFTVNQQPTFSQAPSNFTVNQQPSFSQAPSNFTVNQQPTFSQAPSNFTVNQQPTFSQAPSNFTVNQQPTFSQAPSNFTVNQQPAFSQAPSNFTVNQQPAFSQAQTIPIINQNINSYVANQLIANQIENVKNNLQKSVNQVKPIIDQIKPTIDQIKPTIDQIKPTIDQIKPTINQVKPIINQNQQISNNVTGYLDDNDNLLVKNINIKHPIKLRTDPIIREIEQNNDPYAMLDGNNNYTYGNF
jgi:hypothetical protein